MLSLLLPYREEGNLKPHRSVAASFLAMMTIKFSFVTYIEGGLALSVLLSTTTCSITAAVVKLHSICLFVCFTAYQGQRKCFFQSVTKSVAH